MVCPPKATNRTKTNEETNKFGYHFSHSMAKIFIKQFFIIRQVGYFNLYNQQSNGYGKSGI